jgi:Bacterial Ig-like domain
MRVSKLGLFVLLALTLSACFRKPTPVDESISSNAGLIASTLPINGATNVRGQKVIINFSEAMDTVAVERSFALFAGKYDPAINPTTFTPLQLTSMCNGRWRVRNPNAVPISFNWDIYLKQDEKGVGVVPGSSDVFFTTSPGSRTVRLFVGTQQQQVKASNNAACKDSLFTFAWSADGKTATITPTTAFAANTNYTTTLSTLAKSQAGKQLTAPFSFGFKTYDPNGPTRTEGALAPGGSFTGVDGITVKASKYLDKNLQLYVERLTDTSGLIPLSWAKGSPLKAETAYYKIGATQNYRLRPGAAFSVRVPLPEGVSPQGLAIFELASTEGGLKPLPRPGGPIPSEVPYTYWSSAPVTYYPATNEISFPSSSFTTKGSTFVIVYGRYGTKQNSLTASIGEITAQAQTTPTFEAVCAEDLFKKATTGETCNQKAIDQAVAALQKAYTAFHDTYGFPPPNLTRDPEDSGPYRIELRPASYVDVCVPAANGYCQVDTATGETIMRQDLGGQYDGTKSDNRIIWAAVYPVSDSNPDGGFTSTQLEAIVHEFFHAMQWGFDSVVNFSYAQDGTWIYPKSEASWFIEGITALAQGSLDRLTVTNYFGGLRDLTVSLYSADGYYPYKTSQFFKFLADKAGKTSLNFYLPFFTQRQVNGTKVATWNPQSVDLAIQETTDFNNLADAYYCYADARAQASTNGCSDPSDLGGVIETPLVPNPNGSGNVLQFNSNLDSLSIRIFRLPKNLDATALNFEGITTAKPNIKVIPFNRNGVGCVVLVNTDTTFSTSGNASTSVNVLIPAVNVCNPQPVTADVRFNVVELPGQGVALNNCGSILINTASGGVQIWNNGTLTPLTGIANATGVDINNLGHVLARIGDWGSGNYVIWKPDGTITNLPSGFEAAYLNDNDVVAGYVPNGQYNLPKIWKNNTLFTFNVDGWYAYVNGINNQDTAAISQTFGFDDGNFYYFCDTSTRVELLPGGPLLDQPSYHFSALDINDQGHLLITAVQDTTYQDYANGIGYTRSYFRYKGGTREYLNVTGNSTQYNVGLSMNNQGDVVGYDTTENVYLHDGVVWYGNSADPTNLNNRLITSGWHVTYAGTINDNRMILGTAARDGSIWDKNVVLVPVAQ